MVYFILPKTPFRPIGGIKTLFDYALRLNGIYRGEVACILSDSKYLKIWLDQDYQNIKVLPIDTKILKSDSVVIPEVIPAQAEKYPDVKNKTLAVLNWRYFDEIVQVEKLKKQGYTQIITNSKYSRNFLRSKIKGIKISHIPHFIDTKFYKVLTPINERPKNSILILNRKNTHHLSGILEFLKNYPAKVTIVNNVHPKELVSYFNSHQIFINLGYPEGFCRPAAEAMACGMIVVGFTGGGGSDFMLDGRNYFVAPDGIETKLMEKLNLVLTKLDDKERIRISNNAKATIAQKYNKYAQIKALGSVFGNVDSKPKKIKKVKTKEINRNLIYRPSLSILESELFQTRIEKNELSLGLNELKNFQDLIINSKFFKVWQTYLRIKESLLSLSQILNPNSVFKLSQKLLNFRIYN